MLPHAKVIQAACKAGPWTGGEESNSNPPIQAQCNHDHIRLKFLEHLEDYTSRCLSGIKYKNRRQSKDCRLSCSYSFPALYSFTSPSITSPSTGGGEEGPPALRLCLPGRLLLALRVELLAQGMECILGIVGCFLDAR